MHIALTDDLERLLKKRVENGQFPNEEAVVQEALTRFLIEEPSRGSPRTRLATETLEERLPGPFIEDPMVPAPMELPRAGREIACSSPRGGTRQPACSRVSDAMYKTVEELRAELPPGSR